MLSYKNVVQVLKNEIENLTEYEKMRFYEHMSPQSIKTYFEEMKEEIKLEAEKRFKDKIKSTFNKGYGNGLLANSVHAKFADGKIILSADQPYFHFLNRGIKSFDIKKALLGRRIKMKLPNGNFVFKVVKPNSGKNWIHPGLPATNVSDAVQDEMDIWMQNYLSRKIQYLIDIAKD